MATPRLAYLSQSPQDKCARGKGRSGLHALCATKPNNPVNLPYFIALPVVFSASGLVPVVPSSTAKSFAERWARNWRPMPFELQGFTMRLH